MTKFEFMKLITREEQFADLMVGYAKKYSSSKEIADDLKRELTESELQTIKSAAQNGYPVFLSGMQ